MIADPPVFVDPGIGATFTSSYSAAGRSTGGSDAIAFRYVADAIRFCSVGQTIYLRGGTYQELATFQAGRQCGYWLNKAVRCKAYQNEVPIWTCDTIPRYDGVDYGPIVYAAANGAVLEGITIIGTRAAGDSPGGGDLDCNVLVQNNQGITLENCTIREAGHCGVKTLIGDVTIDGCIFEDNGLSPTRDHHGYFSSTGAVFIRNTILRRAKAYALHFYGTSFGAVVEDCTITDNGTLGTPNAGGGILLGGNGGHQIRRNTITNNRNYAGVVFWQEPSINNVLEDNVITGNSGVDVYLDHAIQPQTQTGNTVGTFGTNTDFAAWPH